VSPEKRKNKKMKMQLTIKIGAVGTKALRLAGLTGLLAVAVSLPATAQSRYKVTDLGTLPGLADSYEAENCVNNQGHVAVYANNAANDNAFAGDVSFLWKGPGEITILPGLPGATDTLPIGLNDQDQVVGDSGAAAFSDAHGFLWDRGVMHDLGTLPGDTGSDAQFINNHGFIAGDSYSANGSYRAVVWESSRRIHLLPSLPNWGFSEAVCINDLGQSCGEAGPDANGDYPAVLWQNENAVPISLAKPSGGGSAIGDSINNRGQIVGNFAFESSANSLPCLWQDEDGSLIELGVYGDDPQGVAYQVNNQGQIAGFSGQGLADVTTAHSLLWENGTMIDLQTQIPADSGWVLEQALCINDRGQIGGFGWHNGQLRAYLLTPREGSECDADGGQL
jgi:probable HAF family extracellular repeat protein